MARIGYLIASALALLPSFAFSQTVDSSWPQFKQGSERSSYNANESTITADNVSSLLPVWSYNETSNSYAKSITTFQSSLYYITDLYRAQFNAVSGSFQRGYNGAWRDQAPAVSENVIFYVAGNSVWSAYANKNGVRWSKEIGFVADPLLYWKNFIFTDNVEGLYTAINAKSGSIAWTQKFGTGRIPSCITAKTLLAVHNTDGLKLQALDAATGASKWTYNLSGYVRDIACSDSKVYVPSDKLYIFDVTNGALIAAKEGLFDTISTSDKQIVVTGANMMRAYSVGKRKLLWSTELPGVQSFTSSPAIAGGVVYSARSRGLYALSASDGSVLWSYGPDADWKDIIVANGIVYANNTAGTLQAFSITQSQRAQRRRPTD